MFCAGVTALHTWTLEGLPQPRPAPRGSSKRVGGPFRGEHLDADAHTAVLTHR
jgi:hypothetical protein